MTTERDPLSPTISAPQLAKLLKIKLVYLKLDNLLPSSSFKFRGINHQIKSLSHPPTSIISSSGGNAGISASYCALQNNLPCHVFVPTTTSPNNIKIIQQNGAIVTVIGDDWDQAHSFALKYHESNPGLFIHPFDNQDLWDGHSSIVNELPEFNAIVCSVGGGGLASGIIKGVKNRYGNSNTDIFLVETIGADSFNKTILNNYEPVCLDAITSIATSLGAKQVCNNLIKEAKIYKNLHSIVVSDKTAVEAMVRFCDEFRMLVEPACGAALALATTEEGRREFWERMKDRDLSQVVLVIEVCGGNGVSRELMDKYCKATGYLG